ncbi:CHASE2 domain-containing protein [Campylobacter ureolyticus]|uniref:CHASE2 domain-containing protein n=1 Tax=Campylobacter ureolyticus TaxID=827 RepID=UPI000DF0FA5B|nr:CHASE2 domain-containing protein [Campylobacter ureolyticus]QIX86426.1 CHASE2 domain-containing protein [Campylobacter ureolyticus]STA69773.1 Cyclic di-GMP phosphodiesterase response regulator RpfG [Campylobacter ureolyticus]
MKKIFIFFIFFSIICGFFIRNSSFLPLLDYQIYDLIKPKLNLDRSNSVVVVEIDEKSLETFGQWPWSRILVAKLAQEILLSKPAAFGMDVIFSEKDRTSLDEIKNFYKDSLNLDLNTSKIPTPLLDNDKILATSLEAGNSVLAVFASNIPRNKTCNKLTTIKSNSIFENIDKIDDLICSYEPLNALARANGFINARAFSDGVLRYTNLFFYYKNSLIPSFSVAMLMQVDPNLTLLKDEKNRGLKVKFLEKEVKLNDEAKALNEIYPKNKFKTFSASDVLLDRVDKSEFSGKFVLFGATALGLNDHFVSSGGKIRSGIFYHASLIENFLTNSLVSQPNFYKDLNFYLSVLVLVLLAFVIVRYGYLPSFFVFVLLTVIAFVSAEIKLKSGVYISIGYIIIPVSIIFLFFTLSMGFYSFWEKKNFLKELEEAHSSAIDSMITVVEGKDRETGGHILRTREYVRVLAEYLRKKGIYNFSPTFIKVLCQAVPLHDIGKVAIPDNILNKNGSLDEKEWEIMKKHVIYGKEIIQKAKMRSSGKNLFLNAATNIAYTHHEKWDGSGYPQSLKGDEIPIEGRLMAIADVYDALTSKRAYKEKFSYEKAENMIISESGTHFDPTLIKAFIDLKFEFRKIAQKYED